MNNPQKYEEVSNTEQTPESAFKHKCTKYQIAEDEHAYANVAEDEGYNATEAVLEPLPDSLSRRNVG